jgi:hypothetical protein
MKKGNLAVLCLSPFLLALIGLATISSVFNAFSKDITGIKWNYKDYEGLKDGVSMTLKADPIYDSQYVLDKGNNLVWSIANVDKTDTTVHASLIDDGTNYTVSGVSEGEVKVTCQNEKGNVSKSFTLVVYDKGAILLNPTISSSQSNIDPLIHYGEYDLDSNDNEVKAKVSFTTTVLPSELASSLSVKEKSSNCDFDLTSKTLSFSSTGDAYFTLTVNDSQITDLTYNFNIVKDGINCFTYNDLLYCSNKATTGKPIILRKSFDRLSNVYYTEDGIPEKNDQGEPIVKDKNLALFGNYDFDKNTFNFENEVYKHDTTYNHEYIDQWNSFVDQNPNKGYQKESLTLVSGLHLTSSLYGNGFYINMHDLTYPHNTSTVNGNTLATLKGDELFKGPLPFYCLGTPQNPLIEAFGQDNSGIYLDGDNATIDDVKVRNCDFGNTLANLDYTGSVLDINASNVTITNSVFSSGKNVIRAFSSKDLTIDNSVLENSRNFLLEIGSDEYLKVDSTSEKDFLLTDGTTSKKSIGDFFAFHDSDTVPVDSADYVLDQFLSNSTSGDSTLLYNSLNSLDQNLNDESLVKDNYKTSVTVNDTFFYHSGISSIVMESLFNGPFIYSRSPNYVYALLASMNTDENQTFPLIPIDVSGLSYPSKLSLEGDTRFYDYKDKDTLDLSGLISQRLSEIQDPTTSSTHNVTIDKIFPIKNLLYPQLTSNGYSISKDETDETTGVTSTKTYINIPIAYYGGGVNASSIDITKLDKKAEISQDLSCDTLKSYLSLDSSLVNIALKSVDLVTGFSPFRFNSYNALKDQDLFCKAPNISDLINNAKGGK